MAYTLRQRKRATTVKPVAKPAPAKKPVAKVTVTAKPVTKPAVVARERERYERGKPPAVTAKPAKKVEMIGRERVEKPKPKPPLPTTPPKLTKAQAAKAYTVTGTVKGGRFIDLEKSVRNTLDIECKKKKLTPQSLKFMNYQTIGLLEHQISFEAVVTGSPIAPAVVAAVILAFKVGIVLLGLVVIGEFVIKPITGVFTPPAPPAPPPEGAPAEVWDKYYGAYEKTPEAPIVEVTKGLGNILPLILLAGGAYVLFKAKPWERKKPKEEVKSA